MNKITLWSVVGILIFGGLLRTIVTWRGGNENFSFTKSHDIPSNASQKIYIANEGESSITVIDASNNTIIKTISLSQQYYGKFLEYSAHNVQVSPDGTIITVTANVAEEENEGGHAEGMSNNDQVILIDPISDAVVGRIDIEKGAHLAHVVITNDSTRAYAVSQEKSKLYTLSLDTQKIETITDLPEGSLPHGIRLSTDGKYLYIAFIGEKALGIFDTQTNNLQTVSVGDKAMQVAVTPNNKYVFVSLYEKSRIARYTLSNQEMDYIDLPQNAQGPVQIYPSPDSKYLYVADQGYYFGKGTGHAIFKVDTEQATVLTSYTGGDGPHGIVVSSDGSRAYATNLLSNTLTVIDTTNDQVIDTVQIGKTPNGISIWTKGQGGTP